MKLPNAENAFLDIRKLREYALDPEDPRGRHKARVFKSALGFTTDDAETLSNLLLEAIKINDCSVGEQDFYGQRYTVDCKIETSVGVAAVRSGWIIRQNENFPRLTTCFVLKKRRNDR